MNSPIDPAQLIASRAKQEAPAEPAAPPQPTPSPTTGYDRNRLKQIDRALNYRIRKHPTTSTPHQIEIDI